MIGNLSAEGIIPEQLGEMGHLIRMITNAGSHDAEFDIDERFVDPIDDFFRAVVRYVYELPSRIQRVREEYENAMEEAEEAQ